MSPCTPVGHAVAIQLLLCLQYTYRFSRGVCVRVSRGSPALLPVVVQIMYKKILESELRPPAFMSPAAVDLCSKLLVRDPALRLGYGGADELKAHPYFKGIDWVALERVQVCTPLSLHAALRCCDVVRCAFVAWAVVNGFPRCDGGRCAVSPELLLSVESCGFS